MSTKYPISRDISKILEEAQEEYNRQVKLVDHFREKYQEFCKDEEIQKLERQVDELRRYSLHVMSENEHTENAVFQAEHYMKCKNGNRFQYELIGTGIGTVLYVRCPVCGEQKNITDLNSW